MDPREAAGIDPAVHWYYRTKKLPLLEYLDGLLASRGTLDVVDVGAGSGVFAESVMESAGRRLGDVRLVDASYPSDEECYDPRVSGRLIRSRGLPEELRGSLILMMDVLEHVEDDEAFLRSVTGRCRGRNHVFITAPAFMSLWSAHDVFLGHHRRYRLAELRAKAARAGVRVTSAYYLYGLILPFVWLLRRLRPARVGSDLKPASPLVSAVLELACRAEFALRRWNRLGGVTCVVEGVIEAPEEARPAGPRR